MLPVRTQAVSEVSLEQLPGTRCAGPGLKHDAAAPPARSRHQRVSEARLAGASGLGLASDGGLLRLRASLVPAPPAAGGALTDSSSGSGALSLSHPEQRASIAKTTTRQQEKPQKKCGSSAARLATSASVAFGRPVRLHGLLMSSAGLPIAGQPVAILTAPDNGSNAFTRGRSGDHRPGWHAGRRRCRRVPRGSSRPPTRAHPRSCPRTGMRL